MVEQREKRKEGFKKVVLEGIETLDALDFKVANLPDGLRYWI